MVTPAESRSSFFLRSGWTHQVELGLVSALPLTNPQRTRLSPAGVWLGLAWYWHLHTCSLENDFRSGWWRFLDALADDKHGGEESGGG